MILDRSEYPKFLLDFPQLKGISYDGCVANWREPGYVLAHTHPVDDEFHGWLCFRNKMLLKDHQLIKHELAHLLTGHGHDDVWRKKLIQLGGHIEQYEFRYDKRRPAVHVPCFHKACMIERRSQS